MKSTKMRKMKNEKSVNCSALSSMVNGEFVDRSVINRFSTKIVQLSLVEITVTVLEEIIALIVVNRDMSDRTALNWRRRTPDTVVMKLVTMITVNVTEKSMAHKIWYLQLPPKWEVHGR
jgi:hypothetical protein